MTEDLYYKKLESTSTTDLVDMIRERDKQISELEKENLYYKDVVETNTAEWEEQGQRVVALEKENAELEVFKEKCKFNVSDIFKEIETENNLTKAKEIIQELIHEISVLYIATDRTVISPIVKQAEQFLEENK